MVDTDDQLQWRQDARVLGEIGAVLARAEIPRFEVRLPRPLAEKALAAWQRDSNEGPLDPETFEQRMQRSRAAALTLIGLSIERDGRWDDDHVTIELSAVLIGDAITASDDLEPLDRGDPPESRSVNAR